MRKDLSWILVTVVMTAVVLFLVSSGPSPWMTDLALVAAGAIVGIGVRSIVGYHRPRFSDASHAPRPASKPKEARGRSRASGQKRSGRSGEAQSERSQQRRKPKQSNGKRAKKPSVGAQRGKIRWFSDRKGFGFITPDDGEEDVFVHRSSIQGASSLSEGATVAFDVGTDADGRRAASNVTRVGD